MSRRHSPSRFSAFFGHFAPCGCQLGQYMVLGKNKRVLYTPTQQTPSLVHAVGASKYIHTTLQWWWDRPDGTLPRPQDWDQVRVLAPPLRRRATARFGAPVCPRISPRGSLSRLRKCLTPCVRAKSNAW
eukprot:1636325-Pleurochrysis_carterae.AAC.2